MFCLMSFWTPGRVLAIANGDPAKIIVLFICLRTAALHFYLHLQGTMARWTSSTWCRLGTTRWGGCLPKTSRTTLTGTPSFRTAPRRGRERDRERGSEEWKRIGTGHMPFRERETLQKRSVNHLILVFLYKSVEWLWRQSNVEGD